MKLLFYLEEAKMNDNLSKQLLTLVKQVAQEEKFETGDLEEKYHHYYIPSLKNGHRCVDGRAVLEVYKGGESTGYKNENNLGDQFPGGTFGIIGALRMVVKLNENKTREVVKKVCDQNNIRMGDHIDDGHGQIKTKEELEQRVRGCGNQDAAGDGKIPMYADLVDENTIKDRFSWLRANNGAVPVLTGEHEEKLAAVNLEAGKTFNTSKAVSKGKSIFNADLVTAHELGGYIFDELTEIQHQGPVEKQVFQKAFVKEVVRDYMQTLVALGGGKKMYIHHGSQI